MTPDEDRALKTPWGEHPLGGGETRSPEIGPLLLRIRRRDDEVWIARDDASVPGELEWLRWPMQEPPDQVHLAPVLPPRTVVAEPEVPFRLLPDARARVFVRVPLWVRITAGGTDGPILTEVPTVDLSDTWWGDLGEGELCYWLGTTARRSVPPEVFAPHLAVCPLQLVNRSRDDLPVERFSLRVELLSVFAEDGRLWSDETRVRYRGVDEESRLEVSGRRPDEAPDAVRVTEAREPPPASGFRGRSVARLKSLPGLAGL